MPEHLEPHKWQKGISSPNKQGRPKSLKTILQSEYAITQTQCNDVILSMLAMTKAEIEQQTNNADSPMFYRIVGKAMLKSFSNGSLYALESLLNRAVGMPKQQTDITTTQERPIFVTLDIDGNTQPLNLDVRE
jgi:hypothetical protein